MADAHLEITPDTELTFTLSTNEATPRCTMDLRHPNTNGQPIAFKVKTTQPRRYLVRPNQGLIECGSMQSVQILLVEKDKTSLLQSYQRLGQTALDHSKDKFLVQSVAVQTRAVSQLKDYDQLTSMWASVSTGGSNNNGANNSNSITTGNVANRKLHVRHVVSSSQQNTGTSSNGGSEIGGTAPATPSTNSSSTTPLESMSHEQLVTEMTGLRRKYDELVAFSVNLTAERDILNNTLEQTKRDLNRELAKSSNAPGGPGSAAPGGTGVGNHHHGRSNEQSSGVAGGALQGKAGTGDKTGFVAGLTSPAAIFMATMFLMIGVKLQMMSMAGFLQYIPIVGGFFRGPAANQDDYTDSAKQEL